MTLYFTTHHAVHSVYRSSPRPVSVLELFACRCGSRLRRLSSTPCHVAFIMFVAPMSPRCRHDEPLLTPKRAYVYYDTRHGLSAFLRAFCRAFYAIRSSCRACCFSPRRCLILCYSPLSLFVIFCSMIAVSCPDMMRFPAAPAVITPDISVAQFFRARDLCVCAATRAAAGDAVTCLKNSGVMMQRAMRQRVRHDAAAEMRCASAVLRDGHASAEGAIWTIHVQPMRKPARSAMMQVQIRGRVQNMICCAPARCCDTVLQRRFYAPRRCCCAHYAVFRARRRRCRRRSHFSLFAPVFSCLMPSPPKCARQRLVECCSPAARVAAMPGLRIQFAAHSAFLFASCLRPFFII